MGRLSIGKIYSILARILIEVVVEIGVRLRRVLGGFGVSLGGLVKPLARPGGRHKMAPAWGCSTH